MANDRKRVLVLCTGNSCRSQMAEGWINPLLGEQWEARSAGTAPAARVHPLAVRAMAEVGVDIAGGKPEHVNAYLDAAVGPGGHRLRLGAGDLPGFPTAGGEAPRLLLRSRGGRRHRRGEDGRLPPCA